MWVAVSTLVGSLSLSCLTMELLAGYPFPSRVSSAPVVITPSDPSICDDPDLWTCCGPERQHNLHKSQDAARPFWQAVADGEIMPHPQECPAKHLMLLTLNLSFTFDETVEIRCCFC
ncbi:hypothetical protein BR93DRAFT_531541 [Coniochaeta sp. PMI_546]|nr:hypothetical protein BR93DRAFT_531541 [Coniochaeta sp. PMI_546]